tara:strand:- start:140 stop:472 length:333 start_codon:yes stop_codon:yes gene_type:complete
MSLYQVSAKEYFDILPSSVKYSSKSTFTGTYENIQKCKVPITNLVQRFKLENKHIISLACGTVEEIKNEILKVFSIEPEFNFPKINLIYRFIIWPMSIIKNYLTNFLKRD